MFKVRVALTEILISRTKTVDQGVEVILQKELTLKTFLSTLMKFLTFKAFARSANSACLSDRQTSTSNVPIRPSGTCPA